MPPQITICVGQLTRMISPQTVIILGKIIHINRPVLLHHIVGPSVMAVGEPCAAQRHIDLPLGISSKLHGIMVSHLYGAGRVQSSHLLCILTKIISQIVKIIV